LSNLSLTVSMISRRRGPPASQGFGPAKLLASLVRSCDHVCLPQLMPALMRLLACKPFVSYIGAVGRRSTPCLFEGGIGACGQKRLGQVLIRGVARTEAKAGSDPLRCDREQEVKPLIPPQTIAPSYRGWSRPSILPRAVSHHVSRQQYYPGLHRGSSGLASPSPGAARRP